MLWLTCVKKLKNWWRRRCLFALHSTILTGSTTHWVWIPLLLKNFKRYSKEISPEKWHHLPYCVFTSVSRDIAIKESRKCEILFTDEVHYSPVMKLEWCNNKYKLNIHFLSSFFIIGCLIHLNRKFICFPNVIFFFD